MTVSGNKNFILNISRSSTTTYQKFFRHDRVSLIDQEIHYRNIRLRVKNFFDVIGKNINKSVFHHRPL